MTKRHGRRMVFEPLEPRILFSADPISAAALPNPADSTMPASVVEPLAPLNQNTTVLTTANMAVQQAGPTLVVVDSRAIDLWAALRDPAQTVPDNSPLHAIVINAGEDGIAAISRALAQLPESASNVEIVGYAGERGIELGTTRLDLTTIRARANELAQWSTSLTADAELRINHASTALAQPRVAPDSSQEPLVAQALSQLTGAQTEIIDLMRPATADKQVTAQQAIREVVIIDGRVDNPLGLAADVLRDRGDLAGMAVYVLEPHEDGVAQVNRILAAHANLDAVHLLAHGASGLIEIGGTTLNAGNLESYRTVLAGWGAALASDGDLLLYGCSVSDGAAGESFALQLAAITGADVAASSDLTSNARLGGDWVLESQVGVIEAQGLFASEEPTWAGSLAIVSNGTVTSAQSANTNSLTFAHTVATGTDRMLIVTIAIDGLGANVTGVTFNGQALTQIGRGTGNHAVEIWGLVAPPEITANVVVSLGGSTAVAAGAATFNGVDQTAPTSGFASATGTGTNASVDVTSATGDLVVDVQYWDDNPSGGAVGPGQTLSWSASNVMMMGGSTTEAGAATVTMSGSVGSSVQWNIAGVSLAAATGNAAPVLNVPVAQSTPEDTNLVFSAGNGNLVSITDPDASGATVELSLSVTNGTMSLSSTTGLTFFAGDGSADSSMGFRGTLADVNAALNGMFYAPTANFNGGATLSLATTDTQLASLNIDVGLLGRYTFEGDANDVAPGAAQNGTLVNGASFFSDPTRGQVLNLDGADDHVQISGTFSNPSEITIGGWVNLLAPPAARGEFISLSDRVHIALDDFAGVKGSVQIGASSWVDLNSNQFIASTGWHHIMYTYSDSSDVHTLYIDGNVVASAAVASSVYWTGATDTFIGRHPSNGHYPQARVDDVRIYNRVLTAGEIATLANDLALTDTGSVALTVTAVNDAPVLSAASLSLNEGQTVTLAPANFSFSDSDSASFTFILTGVSGGNFQLSSAPGSAISSFTDAQLAAGIVQFVDDGNELAPVFSVTVSDGLANSNQLAATIGYTPVNDAPMAVDDSAATPVNTPVSGNVLTNDTDLDGGALSVTQFQIFGDATVYSAGNTANIIGTGSLTLQANGNFTFTPDAAYNGAVPTATYVVSDGAGGSSSGTLSINVGVSATGWGITGTGSLTEGAVASYSLTLSQSLLPGQSASVNLSLTDIGTTAGDRANFVAAVNAAIASRPELSFDGTRLTYSAPASSSYVQSYNPTGAGGATSISGTGTSLNLGDDATSVQSLGFDFQFFGTTYNSILIDANGEVMFNTSLGSNYVNVDMSGGNVLSGSPAIMAFWDDLDSAAGGDVYAQTIGTAGSRQFIVEWSNVPYYASGSADGATIQLVLNEGSNTIELRYIDVDFGTDASHDNGASATIGIQNGIDTGFQFSFDTASITSGAMVTYTPQAATMAPLTINLGTVDDAAVELAETYRIDLSNAINSGLTADFQITTAINDNDNLPPVANSDSLAVTEDTPALLDVLSNDTDPNGQTLVVSTATIDADGNGSQDTLTLGVATGITDNAANPIGTITVNANGLVSFSPATDYFGAAPTLTYTASDGFGGTNTSTMTIGPVTAVNDAPVLTSASLTLSEGQTVTLAALNFSITDPDSATFTYTLSAITGGYFELSTAAGTPITSFTTAQLSAGTVQFVDDGDEVAPSFSVTVNDGALNSNTLAASITYTPVNDAPVIAAASLTLNEGQTVTLAPANFSITDPDNANFTFALSAITGGYFQLSTAAGTPVTSFTSAQLSGGIVEFVDDGDSTAPAFSVTVNDGALNSNTFAASISFTPVNDAPVITAASLTVSEGQTVTLTAGDFSITDPDSIAFTYTLSAITGGYFQLSTATGTPITTFTTAQLASGFVQFVHDGNEIAPSFSVTVNDGSANSNTLAASVSYTPVNDQPVITAASLTLSEGQTVTLSPADFSVNDPDNAGFIYTVSAISGGFFQLSSAPGTPITSFSSAQLAGGLVQFVDDGNELAPGYSVTVNDGTANSNTLAATVNYTALDDAPVVTAASLTLSEGQTVTLAPANVTVSDPDSAVFSYTVSVISGGYFQLSSAAGVPITTFTDAELTGGLVQFVDDGNELSPSFSIAASDGSASSPTVAATISYTPVNDAPSLTAATLTLNEGQTVTLAAGNFTLADPDSAAFTFTLSAISGGYFQLSSAAGVPITSFSTAQLTAGQVQFVDDGNELAPSFDVQIDDGALSSGVVSAAVSYTPVNDPPTLAGLSGDALSYNEGDGARVIEQGSNAFVSDVDTADFAGGNLTIAIVAGGDAGEDVLSVRHEGTAAGQIGVSGATLLYSGVGIGSITGGSSGAPLVISLTAGADAAALTALLRNIDYTNTDVGNPTGGTRTVRFVLDDGNGGTSINHDADVIVNGVNNAPVLTGAALTINEAGTVTLAGTDITLVDPDSSSFVYTISALAGGYLQLSGTPGTSITSFTSADLSAGVVQFIDDGDEVAPAFSLTANDGSQNSNTLAATVNFTPVNDAPVLSAANLNITEGLTLTLSPTDIAVSDPDSATFTYTLSGLAGGFFQLSSVPGTPITSFTTADLAGGSVQFVDDGDESAPAFTLTANDGSLPSNALPGSVTFAGVNDAPVITAAAAAAVLEDNTLVLNGAMAISVADADVGLALLQVRLSVSQGSLTLAGTAGLTFDIGTGSGDALMQFTGTAAAVNTALDGLSYAPLAHYNGADAISLSVSDLGNSGLGGALTANASVALTIGAVNDAPSLTLPAAQLVAEDSELVFSASTGNPLLVSDLDLASGNLRLQLSVSQGVLSLSSVTGLSFVTGSGTGNSVLVFDGSAADINAALNGLRYTVNPNFNGIDSLQLALSDLGNTGAGGALSVNGSVSIAVSADNDAPLITLPALLSVSEDTALVLSIADGNAITLSDADAGSNFVELTLTADRGYFSLASLNGLSFVVGTGSNDLQTIVRGSIANLNAALDGLTYLPEANFNGRVNITVDLNDLGNVGSGSALADSRTLAIDITPVNDAPVDLLRVPALFVTENASTGTSAGDIIAIDLDNSAGFAFDLLDNAGHFRIDAATGTITVASEQLPNYDERSSYQISVRVTDADGASIDRTFNILAARREFVPPPPAAREVGQPVSSGADRTTTNERVNVAVSDGEVDSRGRRRLIAESGQTASRKTLATPFSVRASANDAGLSSRNQQTLANEATRSEALTVQVSNGNGDLLARRSFDLRRMLNALQFSQQRDDNGTGSEFADSRWVPRMPADLIQWDNKESDGQAFHVSLESVQMGGVAISIGLVFYALRAGGLMAAMLTAIPAWTGIDPLVVLSRAKGERPDQWDDSQLEEMAQDEAAVRDVIEGDRTAGYADTASSLTAR